MATAEEVRTAWGKAGLNVYVYGMLDDGSFDSGSKEDPYALPGLFARWQLDLGPHDREAENPGLDLTKLSEIEVEFGIRYEK